ncbi:MAG: uroporphyrinogen decarboxylase family protein [Finegoldia sp.]|nr:uroporphyrinogen decarboxylase family protein [Finegoldia sp.]
MDKAYLYEDMKNYPSKLTSFERSEKYFNGEVVDHLPFDIPSFEFAYGNSLGYTLADMRRIEVLSELIKVRIEKYGINGIGVAPTLKDFGKSMGSIIAYPENQPEYVEKYVLANEIDLSLLDTYEMDKNPVFLELIDRARVLKKKFPDEEISTHIDGPITLASGIRPMEKLLRDFRKDPENLDKLFSLAVDLNISWVKLFVKNFGKVSVSIADPIASNDVLSPRQFEKFYFKHFKRMIDEIFEITSKKPSMHICGHTKAIWKFLKELPISSFSIDNLEDLSEAKEILGDKMTIAGNVDPVEVMNNGSIDDVIEAVRSCIDKAADNKCGYIVFTGCDIPITTPMENIDAFVYAIRKYSRNAQLGKISQANRE